ncbi:MAG: hypothetical protein Kow0077_08140 [Anaerolineae bacterium]
MKKVSLALFLVALLALLAVQSVMAQDPPPQIEIVGYVEAITDNAIVVDGYAIPRNDAVNALIAADPPLAVGDRVLMVGYMESTVIGEYFVVETIEIVPADDLDLDGWTDDVDNCPADFNDLQEDADGDGIGDACDPEPEVANVEDADADGVVDVLDNCPATYNPDQADADEDGLGDACDDTDDTATEEPTEYEGCLQENHPVAMTYAQAFGVDYGLISEWACEYGMGEIGKALLMADQVEFSDLETILASAGEMGWGEVLKASGLSPSAFAPGQVISGRYRSQGATVDAEMLQEQIQNMEQEQERERPGNSGNAPGHNRDNGDGPGNSANAPGHNRDGNGPGNSANAPGQIKKQTN